MSTPRDGKVQGDSSRLGASEPNHTFVKGPVPTALRGNWRTEEWGNT